MAVILENTVSAYYTPIDSSLREFDLIDSPWEIAMLRKGDRRFIIVVAVFAWMPIVGAVESTHGEACGGHASGPRLWLSVVADGWRGRSKNGGKVVCVRTGNNGLAGS